MGTFPGTSSTFQSPCQVLTQETQSRANSQPNPLMLSSAYLQIRTSESSQTPKPIQFTRFSSHFSTASWARNKTGVRDVSFISKQKRRTANTSLLIHHLLRTAQNKQVRVLFMGLLSSSTAPAHSAKHAAVACFTQQHPRGGREDGEMCELQAKAGQGWELRSRMREGSWRALGTWALSLDITTSSSWDTVLEPHHPSAHH